MSRNLVQWHALDFSVSGSIRSTIYRAFPSIADLKGGLYVCMCSIEINQICLHVSFGALHAVGLACPSMMYLVC